MSVSELKQKTAPNSLDPSREEILQMGRAAVQVMADYYASLPNLPIFPDMSSRAIRDKLDSQLPVEGKGFASLLQIIEQVIFPSSRHNGHPRFFGYVASPGTAATAIADLLASTLNPAVTSWRSAPAATDVERLTIDWVKEIMGYPPEAGGLFVSGGSMANFCGLAVARDAHAPQRIGTLGAQVLDRPMRVYISEEGHHSVGKAARLLGIGEDNVRSVAVNARFQMDTLALARMIAEDRDRGYLPFCVVGSPGTTNTGSCDRLEEVAEVTSRYGLWFHVDACYGGWAALAPSKRALFRGIDRADSVALDPHKWLYVPGDASCILYRDPARARVTFGSEADYIRVLLDQPDETYAFWDYGPELTRRFRALKVWMMLSHVGTRALGEAIERNCRCAQYLGQRVERANDFEMLAPVELSVFCFRYVPPAVKMAYATADTEQRAAMDRELNALNEQILKTIQLGGHSYLSNATLGGRMALRGCVLNFRTTERDMEILLEDVRAAGRRLSADA